MRFNQKEIIVSPCYISPNYSKKELRSPHNHKAFISDGGFMYGKSNDPLSRLETKMQCKFYAPL